MRLQSTRLAARRLCAVVRTGDGGEHIHHRDPEHRHVGHPGDHQHDGTHLSEESAQERALDGDPQCPSIESTLPRLSPRQLPSLGLRRSVVRPPAWLLTFGAGDKEATSIAMENRLIHGKPVSHVAVPAHRLNRCQAPPAQSSAAASSFPRSSSLGRLRTRNPARIPCLLQCSDQLG